jgi:hypothetical protein
MNGPKTTREFDEGDAMNAIKLPLILGVLSVVACSASSGGPPPTVSCPASCQDDAAVLALRQAVKLVYNLALQGRDAGAQDQTVPCPLGGSAMVSGTATSNADQGTTTVDLTYVFSQCQYSQVDSDATRTFQLTLDGSLHETGTLAVDPSSSTALSIATDPQMNEAITISGTVFSPAIPYDASTDAGPCAVMLMQDGDSLAGWLCGRMVGASL